MEADRTVVLRLSKLKNKNVLSNLTWPVINVTAKSGNVTLNPTTMRSEIV